MKLYVVFYGYEIDPKDGEVKFGGTMIETKPESIMYSGIFLNKTAFQVFTNKKEALKKLEELKNPKNIYSLEVFTNVVNESLRIIGDFGNEQLKKYKRYIDEKKRYNDDNLLHY